MRKGAAVKAAGMALILTAGTTACGLVGGDDSKDKADRQPLKFGYLLPESGPLAQLSPPQIASVKFAIDQINQAGGVLGKKLPPVVAADEGGQDETALAGADKLLQAKVQAVVGAASSARTLAVIDKITRSDVLQCSPSNTAVNLTSYQDFNFFFRTTASDTAQGPVLGRTVIEDGHKKVQIIARADAYGRGLADATAQAIKHNGGVSSIDAYDPATTDFKAHVERIKTSKADAVVVLAFDEGAEILKEMLRQNLGPSAKLGVYGGDGMRNEKMAANISPQNRAVLAGMKGTAPASVENTAYTEALRTFDPSIVTAQYAAQSADCVTTIALAAEAAESTAPEKVRDKMVDVTRSGVKCATFTECRSLLRKGEDIDFEGASGPLDFTPDGEPESVDVEVYTYEPSGELKTLKTLPGQAEQG